MSKPATEGRRADPDTQLETDILMLDYLIQKTCNAILSQTHTDSSYPSIDRDEFFAPLLNGLCMFDSFILIFQSSHARGQLPPLVNFRLRLLQFTCVYILRTVGVPESRFLTSESLFKQRWRNRERLKTWLQSHDLSLLDDPDDEDIARVFPHFEHTATLPIEPLTFSSDLLLLDILPLFIQLAISRVLLAENRQEWTSTRQWLELAQLFMLSAAKDAVEGAGLDPCDAIVEACAWGPMYEPKVQNDAKSATDTDPLAAAADDFVFFYDDEPDGDTASTSSAASAEARNLTLRAWHQYRNDAIRQLSSALIPNRGTGSLSQDSIAQLPYIVRSFLEALLQSVEAPLLVQLEDLPRTLLVAAKKGASSRKRKSPDATMEQAVADRELLEQAKLTVDGQPLRHDDGMRLIRIFAENLQL